VCTLFFVTGRKRRHRLQFHCQGAIPLPQISECGFWNVILVLHCNYISILHRFRYNELFLFAAIDVFTSAVQSVYNARMCLSLEYFNIKLERRSLYNYCYYRIPFLTITINQRFMMQASVWVHVMVTWRRYIERVATIIFNFYSECSTVGGVTASTVSHLCSYGRVSAFIDVQPSSLSHTWHHRLIITFR